MFRDSQKISYALIILLITCKNFFILESASIQTQIGFILPVTLRYLILSRNSNINRSPINVIVQKQLPKYITETLTQSSSRSTLSCLTATWISLDPKTSVHYRAFYPTRCQSK